MDLLLTSTNEKRGFTTLKDARSGPQRFKDVQGGPKEVHRDREKPERRLRPENCLEDQKISQLKLKTCSTTFTRNIGSPTDIGSPIDIERLINISNTSGNKEVNHLPYGDSEEVDHLLQIVRIQCIIKKEAREVVSRENPYILEVQQDLKHLIIKV